MHPLSPVIPNQEADETVYAKDQPEYIPLPSVKTPDGVVLTRWSLNEQERREVAEQGYLYLLVNTFNTQVPEGMDFNTKPLDEWPSEISDV